MFDINDITMKTLNISTLFPMLIAIGGGLLILVIDLIKANLHKSLYIMLTILILLIDLGAILGLDINSVGFFNMIYIDGISILTQIIIIVGSVLFIPLGLTYKRFHEYSYPEFFALFLFMIASFQFISSTNNLILIFIGLETASLSLYTLIALHNRRNSFEAAVKYFTMGALAGAFLAMGIVIIYGLSGSLDLAEISKIITLRFEEEGIILLTLVSGAFILAAFSFKLSLFPFHTWAPDAYEGASAPLAGYMSIVPKIVIFVVFMRVLGIYLTLESYWIQNVIFGLAILTMTVANLMALVQEDVKRMLAYSSISHAGFVMIALGLGTTKAYTGIFLYYILFLFANLGAFTMLWVSRHKSQIHHKRFDHPYQKFSGMIKIMPAGAIVMAIFMLTLSGIPPFSLFWGKIYLMSATIDAGFIWIAVIMGLNSAIAAYYYLKLIVYMFLKEPLVNTNEETVYFNISRPLITIIGLSIIVIIFSIFFVGDLIDYITLLVSTR